MGGDSLDEVRGTSPRWYQNWVFEDGVFQEEVTAGTKARGRTTWRKGWPGRGEGWGGDAEGHRAFDSLLSLLAVKVKIGTGQMTQEFPDEGRVPGSTRG